MYADVLVELKAKQIDKTFTYLVPSELQKDVEVGKRVLVPFGKQTLEGFILKITNNKDIDFNLKEIIKVIDENPVLNCEMIELGKYISRKTLCNLISAFQTMLPTALKAHKNFNVNKKYISYIKLLDEAYIPKNDNQRKIIDLLSNGKVLKSELSKISVSSLNTLLSKKVICEQKEESYRLQDNQIFDDKKVTLTNDQKKLLIKY